MKTFRVSIVWLILAGGFAVAQTAAPLPAFETASLKPAALHSIRNFVGGPGSKNPGQISYTNASLEELLLRAYGLEEAQRISGPDWLGDQRYDLVAKLPAETTKEQLQKMLQRLLAEKLKVQIHHESKDVPAYDLVVAEGGLKLKPGEALDPARLEFSSQRGNYPTIPDGVPAMAIAMDSGRARLRSRQEPPFVLAKVLSGPAGRPIVDKTGVTARYDFVLDFDLRLAAGQAPKQAAAPLDDPAPSLFDAVQQQLGLKLVESKTAVDIVVVDRAEKTPSGD
jgi:uncharacterized protein (TIGR03435 family)